MKVIAPVTMNQSLTLTLLSNLTQLIVKIGTKVIQWLNFCNPWHYVRTQNRMEEDSYLSNKNQ